MLHFNSWDAYDSTLQQLLDEVEDAEVTFLNTYPNATPEELDSVEDFGGYDENAVLHSLANSYGHTSALGNFLAAEDNWLNTDVQDTTYDPEFDFWGLTEEELTLVNKQGAIAIDSAIYVFRIDSLYSFSDMNWTGYLDFVAEEIEPDLVFFKTPKKPKCSAWKYKSGWAYYSNNRAIKRYIRFHNYPLKGVSKAKIKSYRKRRGRYRLSRASIGCTSNNHFRSYDCNSPEATFVDTWRDRNRRRRLTNFAAYRQPVIMRVQPGDVIGGYRYNNTFSTLTLVW